MTTEAPPRLEDTDPELAKIFQDICHRRSNIKSVRIGYTGLTVQVYEGIGGIYHEQHFSFDLGRNDKCPCGSGKKFKKCHSGGALGAIGRMMTG